MALAIPLPSRMLIVLRYAMLLRFCYAMRAVALLYELRLYYAMCGTEAAYGARWPETGSVIAIACRMEGL
eukprot:430116-Rhodomonas_salina.2